MRQRLAISPVLCTFDPYNSEAALVNTLIAMNTTHLVYLIGARASGKTTVGRMLARRLGLPFVDTDAHVVAALGEAIADVVATAELPEHIRHDLALHAGCIAGASSIEAVEGMLQAAGFAHIRITPKIESKALIRQWNNDPTLAEYIVSATIEAVKPAVGV